MYQPNPRSVISRPARTQRTERARSVPGEELDEIDRYAVDDRIDIWAASSETD